MMKENTNNVVSSHYNSRKRCRDSTRTTMGATCPKVVFITMSLSTLLTVLLISGSVHCFQAATASPSHQRNNIKNTYNDITTYTRHCYRDNCRDDRRKRDSRLSASTAIPPSYQKQQQQYESASLFYRDYDTNQSCTLTRHSPKSKQTNTSLPINIHQSSTLTKATKSNNYQQTASTISSEARKAWERKYCSVAGLRESFGTNRNIVWGDFDASITRRLYKCLLPVALLELYETGHVPPQDLAPLAYRARIAAKLYARERSHVPARIAAAAFDGYRQWRKYGSFDCTGMSYDQVWNKYAAMITQETSSKQQHQQSKPVDTSQKDHTDDKSDSVTAKICLKILERSCHSNEMIDRLVLKHQKSNGKYKSDVMLRRQRRLDLQALRQVSEQLERDVQLLLQQPDKFIDRNDDDEGSIIDDKHTSRSLTTPLSFEEQKQQAQKFRALRAFAKVKRRIANLQKHFIGSGDIN
jgi:hypothetical protein